MMLLKNWNENMIVKMIEELQQEDDKDSRGLLNRVAINWSRGGLQTTDEFPAYEKNKEQKMMMMN